MKVYPIVIITEEYDSHADEMMILLREMGQNPTRIHTEDFPQHASLSLSSNDGSNWKSILKTRRCSIPLDEVRSIWWRRPARVQLPDTLTPYEEAFARSELTETLTSMWEMIEHSCYWVSFPANIRKAEHKISQLQLAAQLGLEVPRTVVSTNPDDVRFFYEACHGRMIYKPLANSQPSMLLSGSSLAEQWKYCRDHPHEKLLSYGIYTTPIREQDLALLDSIRLAPGIFQEYIPKRVELRVTVIGDDIFSAEMHSQVHEETRYDWRHYEVEVPTYEHKLPLEVAEKCLALTKAYGLHFSTSDLIVTPDGRYVFLEMNPNGQFLWVQNRVPTLQLKEAMAACLIRGSNA